MKQVILVRHAKAVPYGYDDDFNRPLTDRGENDATSVGQQLQKAKIEADYILSSPAKRAKQTAMLMSHKLNFPAEQIVFNRDIYDGITTQEFIDLIHALPQQHKTVMVFGHNPTIYYLISNLLHFFNADIPTCSTVGIEFNVEKWEDIEVRKGKLSFHYVPKMFRD